MAFGFVPGLNCKSRSVMGTSNCKSTSIYQYCARQIASLQAYISTAHVKLQVYKHISVLCTSKNKSASLTSLCQDLEYACKLIPKSKPTFQKLKSENFEFKKFSQRATILAFFWALSRGAIK